MNTSRLVAEVLAYGHFVGYDAEDMQAALIKHHGCDEQMARQLVECAFKKEQERKEREARKEAERNAKPGDRRDAELGDWPKDGSEFVAIFTCPGAIREIKHIVRWNRVRLLCGGEWPDEGFELGDITPSGYRFTHWRKL